MMTTRCLLLMCSVLAFTEQLVPEGGCLQDLPDDGMWARYQVAIKIGRDDQNAQWTVRSVGKASYQGTPCRWIEMEQSSESDRFPKMTWRCLVPESEFGAGKHPLGRAVKVWQIIEGSDPISAGTLQERDALFSALIQGPDTEVKMEASPEIVRWQRGNLECSVAAGNRDVKLNDFVHMRVRYRFLRHADAPFHLGGAHWSLTVIGGDENSNVDVKMMLQDSGTEAMAKYPDLAF